MWPQLQSSGVVVGSAPALAPASDLPRGYSWEDWNDPEALQEAKLAEEHKIPFKLRGARMDGGPDLWRDILFNHGHEFVDVHQEDCGHLSALPCFRQGGHGCVREFGSGIEGVQAHLGALQEELIAM